MYWQLLLSSLLLLPALIFQNRSLFTFNNTNSKMAASKANVTLKLGTWNLRFDTQPDPIPPHRSLETLPDPLEQPRFMNLSGEQPWSKRRVGVMQQIVGEGVAVIGFQEALIRQVRDLEILLGDDWDWVGVGRDDGLARGEFSPIFYKKSVLTLESWDPFWLSPTPFTPSRYPGAGSLRVCTVARFTVNPRLSWSSSDPPPPGSPPSTPPPLNFTLLNTHLDDRSDAQRAFGASMMRVRARYEAWTRGGVVFVTGDFNSEATGRTSTAYHIQTGTLPLSDDLPYDFMERFSLPGDTLPKKPEEPKEAEKPKPTPAVPPTEPAEPGPQQPIPAPPAPPSGPSNDASTSQPSQAQLSHRPSSSRTSWIRSFLSPPKPFKFKMVDLRGAVPKAAVRGGFATYTSFGALQGGVGSKRGGGTGTGIQSTGGVVDVWVRIDFIFAGVVEGRGGDERAWEALDYNTLNALEDDGLLLSDHRLVTVTLAI